MEIEERPINDRIIKKYKKPSSLIWQYFDVNEKEEKFTTNLIDYLQANHVESYKKYKKDKDYEKKC